MESFRFAVRVGTDDNDRTQIELWASEDVGRPILDGYTAVTLAAYCDAWREKSGLLCAALAARAGQSNETR